MARKILKTPSKKKQPAKTKRPRKKSSGQKNGGPAGVSRKVKKAGQAKKPGQAKKTAAKSNVRKAIAILKVIVASGRPITGAEIQRLAGGSNSAINRTTGMLSKIGFIEPDGQHKGFVVGPGLIELALATLRAACCRTMRRTILEALSLKLDQTIYFGTLSGGDIVLLDRADPKWPLTLRLEVGSCAPAHCTAMGKLLLSQLPSRKLRDTVAAMPLGRHTANTVVERQQLRGVIDEIRETKIGIDNGEFVDGVVCISVLVTADNDAIVGALSVAAPTTRCGVTDLYQFLPEMRKAADQLGQTFRFSTIKPVQHDQG